MDVEFWLNSLEFRNGLNINLEKNSIVVFVGPNNSGKSRTLREILQLSKNNSNNNLILDSLKTYANGDGDDFLKRIEGKRKGDSYFYPGSSPNTSMAGNTLKSNWNDLVKGSQASSTSVSNFLIKSMSTSSRLNLVTPPNNIDFINEMHTHPIQVLKEDTEKELQFSKYF